MRIRVVLSLLLIKLGNTLFLISFGEASLNMHQFIIIMVKSIHRLTNFYKDSQHNQSVLNFMSSMGVSWFRHIELTIQSLTFSASSSEWASTNQTSTVWTPFLTLNRIPLTSGKSFTFFATKANTKSYHTLLHRGCSNRKTKVPPLWFLGSSHTGFTSFLNT